MNSGCEEKKRPVLSHTLHIFPECTLSSPHAHSVPLMLPVRTEGTLHPKALWEERLDGRCSQNPPEPTKPGEQESVMCLGSEKSRCPRRTRPPPAGASPGSSRRWRCNCPPDCAAFRRWEETFRAPAGDERDYSQPGGGGQLSSGKHTQPQAEDTQLPQGKPQREISPA